MITKLNTLTKPWFLLSILLFNLCVSCNNGNTLNEAQASDAVQQYLEMNPQFETEKFQYGETKFSANKDKKLIQSYRTLESKGLITMQVLSKKKKFLSSDSSFSYLIKLTDKAAPLVMDQDKNSARVKTFQYKVLEGKPVNFKTVDVKAEVTIALKKEPTDFSEFAKEQGNSSSVSKTFKLKYSKELGWVVKN